VRKVKRIAFVFIALFVLFAFAGGTVAAEKKAAKPQTMKATGTVMAYEKGKMITVKGTKEEWNFELLPEAKIKGEVKEGAKVTVMYAKESDKMIASSVTVAAEQKSKAKPKSSK
jgi:hypothetical protein